MRIGEIEMLANGVEIERVETAWGFDDRYVAHEVWAPIGYSFEPELHSILSTTLTHARREAAQSLERCTLDCSCGEG